MKRVSETTAGKSISAWVVLKKGQCVAKIQAHYGDSGRVQVDIWDNGRELQQKTAGGGGYDKLAACLRGCTVGGVELYDHCGQDKQTEKILSDYHQDKISLEDATSKARKIGAYFTNWEEGTGKFSSLYIRGGLDRLRDMGFTVIQAI